MTIHEITNQLHSMAVDHRINGEQVTKQWLESYLNRMMRNADQNKIRNSVVMEITLRDGNWLFEVSRFSDAPDGFDYYIPDTREQESRIKERLFA